MKLDLFRKALAVLFLFTLATPALAKDIPHIHKFDLKVGQTRVFYGYIGKKCGVLPSRVSLPKVRIGTLSTGKAGIRGSRRCNGRVPAVEIKFTATKKGRATFRINEDRFTVQVR
ncbi:hypothetical protein [Hoeflea alexandrii]|uniref:hypothetical protein n=1 Tax=Hoeflea alexandrii TaxID=288436 RepID=UPI0022AFA2FE|nr:hypothetical protein [Hoeflea alexandrii]MCZ4289630.1 hypothetical protein [Hoeflea alexandrii]